MWMVFKQFRTAQFGFGELVIYRFTYNCAALCVKNDCFVKHQPGMTSRAELFSQPITSVFAQLHTYFARKSAPLSKSLACDGDLVFSLFGCFPLDDGTLASDLNGFQQTTLPRSFLFTTLYRFDFALRAKLIITCYQHQRFFRPFKFDQSQKM